MGTPISHLGLSTRAHNAMRRGRWQTIEDAKADCSEERLLHLRNVGPHTVAEILSKLDSYPIDDWRI